MVISLFQQDIFWLDPERNFARIERELAEHPETDLMVLPEMCTTGFVTDPQPGTLASAHSIEQRLLSLASRYGTALCGSFAVSLEAEQGGAETSSLHRNRCYFVTPEGEVHHYDKHHLFSFGNEGKGYTPGQQRTVVSWRGIRFCMLICYDLRFPVWARNTRQDTYDVLICVANWPRQRQLAWNTLLPARAIENQAYVIGVNRVGQDDACSYEGGSCAIHPYGHVVAQCQSGEESLCSFEPDMKKLGDFRAKFPSLVDADPFVIG